MSKQKKNPHWGSTLDEFLDEAGIHEMAKAEVSKSTQPRDRKLCFVPSPVPGSMAKPMTFRS